MPRCLLVISYYDRRDRDPLRRLTESLAQFNAGRDYDICVVVNRDTTGHLGLSTSTPTLAILERENTGMNIGAWDHGWRTMPKYDEYLFLQDECYVVRPGWLSAFAWKADQPGIGLVGESFNERWLQPWEDLKIAWRSHKMPDHVIDGKPASRVEVYLNFLSRNHIPAGNDGGHLRSLVWYVKRSVLEQIGGFPIGRNYGECIAAEIGVSKRVEALGLQAVQVSNEPFCYVRHREWVQDPVTKKFLYRRLN